MQIGCSILNNITSVCDVQVAALHGDGMWQWKKSYHIILIWLESWQIDISRIVLISLSAVQLLQIKKKTKKEEDAAVCKLHVILPVMK